MKGIVYRSAALALALVVVCSALAVPSFATDYQSTYNFWNWAYDNSWFLGKAIIGFSAGNVCQVSEDGLHHATTHSGGGGSIDGQRVYNCVCDYCGQEFQAVATDLKDSYEQIVYDDNYNNVSSDGYYRLNFSGWELSYTDGFNYNASDYTFGWKPDKYYSSTYLRSFPIIHLNNFRTGDVLISLKYSFTAQFDGVIEWGNAGCGIGLDGTVNVRPLTLTNITNGVDVATNVTLSRSDNIVAGNSYQIVTSFIWWGLSAGEYDILANVENIKIYYTDNSPDVISRPSTFSPSFSYDCDNGTETVFDQQIIDEQGLKYYNPVTNTTTNVTSWTYDYSDRSYTVVTDSNNTYTVTYGDEYITINEGDNITYNIYYYTAPEDSGDGSGSGSDGEGSGSSGSGDGSDDSYGIGSGLGELLGSLLGGLIDLITGLISGLIDSLINLIEMTIEKLGQVVNLFGEFGDALKVLWSWLPDEVVTILAAGVSVVVFASVIKLFV